MSYHTPDGFDQRCTMRDDNAAHQIRLYGGDNRKNVTVSCTCLSPSKPIDTVIDTDDAWAKWWAWHDSRQIQVTP